MFFLTNNGRWQQPYDASMHLKASAMQHHAKSSYEWHKVWSDRYNTTDVTNHRNYKLADFYIRDEFQQRGSPHEHCLLWLTQDENMPEVSQFDREDASSEARCCEFIDVCHYWCARWWRKPDAATAILEHGWKLSTMLSSAQRKFRHKKLSIFCWGRTRVILRFPPPLIQRSFRSSPARLGKKFGPLYATSAFVVVNSIKRSDHLLWVRTLIIIVKVFNGLTSTCSVIHSIRLSQLLLAIVKW